jgi:hypothetical protein
MDYDALMTKEGLVTVISNLASWVETHGSSMDGSEKEYLLIETKRLLTAIEALEDEA